MKGKLIVIDGTDGSGKATQLKLLAARLRKLGHRVRTADFPQYGKKSAGAVEEYLNGKYGMADPYAASILYATDRFDASFEMKKLLREGTMIVCNRYTTANAGHQGGKIRERKRRQKYFTWLHHLEYGIFQIPRPDLTLILHVPASIAQKLVDKKPREERRYINGKKRDLHEKNLAHLENAEKVFLEIAKVFPHTKLIECVERNTLLSPEKVSDRVWSEVQKILPHR